MKRRHPSLATVDVASAVIERALGDSAEQREAEKAIIEAVSQELRVNLAPRTIVLGGRCCVAVDGVSEQPPILCEVYAHIGPPKSGQARKVMTDAFKLAFAAQHWNHEVPKLFLVFADDAAAKPFRGRSWRAHALRAFGIEVRVVEVSPEQREVLAAAQQRQWR
jgi:hypothetical protein